eukprot:5735687-Pleurochrysis_carterae.AAC.1
MASEADLLEHRRRHTCSCSRACVDAHTLQHARTRPHASRVRPRAHVRVRLLRGDAAGRPPRGVGERGRGRSGEQRL